MKNRGEGLLLMLVLGFCCSCGTSPALETETGWKQLFDGATLSGWEPTRFGGEGTVRVAHGAILLGMGDTLTGITWKGAFPKTGYELALDAQRVRGNDFFCALTFPVGGSFCSLILGGWGGSVTGISTVDGLDASENETSRIMAVENGRWYAIRVRVDSNKIAAWVDDQMIVDLVIGDRRLSVRPEVRLSRPVGIASWQTEAVLKNIRLHYLVGLGR